MNQDYLHAMERMESKELIALIENHSNFVQEIRCQRCKQENLLIAELCHFVQKTQEWHQDQNAMQQVKCLLKMKILKIKQVQVKKMTHKLNQFFQHAMERMESKVLTAKEQKEMLGQLSFKLEVTTNIIIDTIISIEIPMIMLLQMVDKETTKLRKIKQRLSQHSQLAMVQMELQELIA